MDLKVISYNSTGFNVEKANFINFLLHSMNIDVFILQEHLHLRQNVFKIQRELNKHESFILPAVKTSNKVCAGRPSGGTVKSIMVFWCKSPNRIFFYLTNQKHISWCNFSQSTKKIYTFLHGLIYFLSRP